VAVRCGEFRNVDPGSLQFAFESLRKDDISTQHCRLKLEIVPTIATCKAGHEFNPEAGDYYACTTCGEGIQRLLQGEELDVVQVVIETDD
jgi:Zn finger protein HypA/HybF involved in hydrogenase expression